MTATCFLDLPATPPHAADVLLLPAPFDGTTSYGKGTAQGPEAIWRASAQVELWDEELAFALDGLHYHSAEPVVPMVGEVPVDYLRRVGEAARRLHESPGLVIGVGGEHSITPPLVAAAAGSDDLSQVTVVQIDAHADLRDQYDGYRESHACAMRRLVDKGARLVAIGIRSADQEEAAFGRSVETIQTYWAQQLAEDPAVEARLLSVLAGLRGDLYLTIDIDGLEVSLCPGTGTPQPGGLGWWQALRYLRRVVRDNHQVRLIGCDVMETAPMAGSQVNEFVAARLLAKIIAYHATR